MREFGSVSAFKMMSAPDNLGRGHVALGLEGISFTVEEKSDAWNDTFYHPDATHELGAKKQLPNARLAVGVTDRLDLGAFYAVNPLANFGWLGIEAKYGLLRQRDGKPLSLALRGAYTKTLYVDDMDMHAFTADVAAGRTFWGFVTPYVGVGGDMVMARETSEAVDLNTEYQPVSHAFGGLELQFWHVALGAEASQAALASFQVHLTALF